MSLSNAERQARFRDKQSARIAELEAQLRARTLRFWDMSIDDYRVATQSDVDALFRKIAELTAPKITPREGEPPEPAWPRLYVGEIEDGGRRATVGILT